MYDEQTEIQNTPAEIHEGRIVVGAWSKPLTEAAEEAARVRALLIEGRAEDARREMAERPSEEQTALVLITPAEDRERLLSLTGPGGEGYSPAVVNRLPTEVIADLLAVDSDYLKYNVEILRAMSPERFGGVVADTMEPVYYWEHRQKVSWEWLEALAALEDVDHRASLLRSVDPALIEEAMSGILDQLRLDEVVGGIEAFPVTRYWLFSEGGLGGSPPSTYIEEVKIGVVLDALWEASPDLFKGIVQGAWERFSEPDEIEDLKEDADDLET